MRAHQEAFEVGTAGRGLIEVTAQVRAAVRASGVGVGLATVFVHHTSASIIVNENADPAVRADLDAAFARLVPDGDPRYLHADEGPDDMPAHLRVALTATSVGIPVRAGAPDLGTWQGIYLWEHRHRPHRRRLSVTVIGE